MIDLTPIAVVKNERSSVTDDLWGDVISTIELLDPLESDALEGIETFSHVEVIYYFDQVPDEKIETGSRHPRNYADWPKVGIFAQRGKNRPNRLGATIVKVIKHEGKTLQVSGLDAIDGTPVLDIKPVMREFLPREEIVQPDWVGELMKNYWK
jgi:tRNA-Thr(GGU) m(6)t(6)A37 methyltransferase TsaA